jgi:hypothetical protein
MMTWNLKQESLWNDPTWRLWLQSLLANMDETIGYWMQISQQDHKKSWEEASFQRLTVSLLPSAENSALKPPRNLKLLR